MIKLFRTYLKGSTREIICNVFFIVMCALIQTVLLIPASKEIISEGVSNQNMASIWQCGLKMALYSVLAALCTVGSSYFSSRVVAQFARNLRKACYDKATGLSAQDMAHFGGATLFTRTTTDVNQLTMLLLNILRSCLTVPAVILAMLVLILLINRPVFFVLTISFALTIALLIYFGTKSKKLFEILQRRLDTYSGLTREKISGVRAIRAFCNQDMEEKRMLGAGQDIYDASIRANQLINFLSPISLVIMNWVVIAIYLIGSIQVQEKMTSVSDLLVICQYITYFIATLAIIPFMVNLLPKAAVSCRRIKELLSYEGTANQEEGTFKSMSSEEIAEAVRGDIEFRHVGFGYSPDTRVVSDLSFVAKGGKITAFIGATGSGKTTVMNLLQQLYLPMDGEILFDGKDSADMDVRELRRHIAYGTQKAMVFQDTVRNNITTYQPKITEERIRKACEASAFDEVLSGMPDGLDSMMAAGGMNISGGQRQRLSLARMVARDADIYVFDDTFSALDARTESHTRAAIGEMLRGKTIIMVAQKINTIEHADNIVVLDRGRIVGQGRHEELMKSCREYQEIYQTQHDASVKEAE